MIFIEDFELRWEDLARLSPWQFRQLWEALGEGLYLKARATYSSTAQASGQVCGSDSSPSIDEPKSEPGIKTPPSGSGDADPEARLTPPVTIPVDGSEDAPPDSRRPETLPEPAISPAPAAPVDPWYYCVTCGYQAAGPATLAAHRKIHTSDSPRRATAARVHTPAGDLASTFTADETERWVAAMKRGQKVTDDGPSPLDEPEQPKAEPEVPKPEPAAPIPEPPRFEVVNAREAPEPPRLTNPANCCQFCGRECGGVAGRKAHESRCEERPMAKREGCQHHWVMDPPNGPIVRGKCRLCAARREDPASPTPRVGTGSSHESESRVFEPKESRAGTGRYPRPDVVCGDCQQVFKGHQALGSHRTRKHPEAVSA